MTASTGNSVLDGIIKDSSKTLTENGDVAYTTTQNNNLDFFFGASLFRGNDEEAVRAFIKAYTQNKNLAVKNLFYLRDIKGGQGLRSPFRACLAWLAKENPELVINLLPKFVEYGRWDDILFLGLKTEGFDLSCKKQVANISFDGKYWYLSYTEDVETQVEDLPKFTDGLGIDLGIKTLATVSDGTTVPNIKTFRRVRILNKRLK